MKRDIDHVCWVVVKLHELIYTSTSTKEERTDSQCRRGCGRKSHLMKGKWQAEAGAEVWSIFRGFINRRVNKDKSFCFHEKNPTILYAGLSCCHRNSIQVNSPMELECMTYLLTNKERNLGERYQDIGFLRFPLHPDRSDIYVSLAEFWLTWARPHWLFGMVLMQQEKLNPNH